MLRSANDWLKQPQYAGITVMDPDGWDRRGGFFAASWAEEITEEEFEKRLSVSTCLWSGKMTEKVPTCL
jgi:hypothetical protein